MVETSRVVGIEGRIIPEVDLTGVLRASIVSCMRMWKVPIGLCDLLKKERVAVIDNWLMGGHEEWAGPVADRWFLSHVNIRGGIPT